MIFNHETLNGGDDEVTYMHRWRLIGLPGKRRIYLHKFIGPDWTEDPHDHPKWFLSIGLWGWYLEASPDHGLRRFRAPWIRWFPATHRHAIVDVSKPSCWTLVVTGRTTRDWGFWPSPDCWIPFENYIYGKERDCE